MWKMQQKEARINRIIMEFKSKKKKKKKKKKKELIES